MKCNICIDIAPFFIFATNPRTDCEAVVLLHYSVKMQCKIHCKVKRNFQTKLKQKVLKLSTLLTLNQIESFRIRN